MVRKKGAVRYKVLKTGFLVLLFVGLFFWHNIFLSDRIPASVGNYLVKGIDVSKHSGVIDWKRVNSEGFSFAFFKATEGVDYLDPLFKKNYVEAKKAGLLVGAYHFFRFNKDGEIQAKHFLNVAWPKKGDIIPVIDVEFHGNKLSFHSDDEVIAEIKKFVSVIKNKLNVTPLIYTNKEGYDRLIKGNFPDCRLWYCNLKHDPDFDDLKWDFWQYSHRGKIKGTEYFVDLNVFNGELTKLIKYYLYN
ncbi:MAG: hypothetical protein JW717_12400 [Marinilabiliaceae bacterium]|nr:hypothetical protein [Marinilabiliaceae bacterium]